MFCPTHFLTLDPDCMDYKPSTYSLKTRFKINAAGLGGGQQHCWEVQLQGGSLQRLVWGLHSPDATVLTWTGADPPRFKRGRLQGPRVELPSRCPENMQAGVKPPTLPQRGQWKLKGKAALYQQRLRFWDAPRMSRYHWQPSTTEWVRCTWTFVPEDALFSALRHPSLSPLSPRLQGSALSLVVIWDDLNNQHRVPTTGS